MICNAHPNYSGDKMIGVACNKYGEGIGEVYTGFGGETWGKEPPGRPRRRREYYVKLDLKELGCGSVDWIEQA
jgi:hypothetical protein